MEPQLLIHMDIIGLDIDKLEQEFERAIDQGMSQMVERIEKEWTELANSELHSSKDQYLQGLRVEKVGNDLIQATLSGFLAVSVEEGQQAYDMKPGLLGSAVMRTIPIGKRAGEKVNLRRLHAGSPGWHHPGFKAKQLHQQVWKSIDDRINSEVFGDLISRISV